MKSFKLCMKANTDISLENKKVYIVESVNRGFRAFLFTVLFIFLIFFIIYEFGFFHHNKIYWCAYKKKEIFRLDDQDYVSNKDQFEKVVSCYYNTPSLQNSSQLIPSNIDINLCTHINVAFAQVINKTIHMEDYQYNTITELTNLKKVNPKLKILLSVGGAGSHDGFSEMVINHASRKTFIKSIRYILKKYNLNGIDIDWEFPAVDNIKAVSLNYYKRQRQHFSQLLREIRMEYVREKRDYLLTVAVAAQQIIIDVAYDVDQIDLYVDFVNLMTYDYHFYSSFTPFTGLNSPLYQRPLEQLYMATLNINYTVALYKSKGLNANKIVVGIPTYGHTFTLINGDNTKIGSPASGFGKLGNMGFVNYPDICNFIQNFNISVTVDKDAMVPYLHNNLEWISYDSLQSVIKKAEFIKEHRLRGAMIYSLNSDDFEGKCNKLHADQKFPLTMSIKKVITDNSNN